MEIYHLSEREGYWELINARTREIIAVFREKEGAVNSALKFVESRGGRLSLPRTMVLPPDYESRSPG